MDQVELYTDGSCDPSSGAGGWAFILRHVETGQEIAAAGKADNSTNNRMELSAVIEGLKRLDRRCEVFLVADSKYVLDGLRSWLHAWKKNGWKKSDKKPVKNQDLWMELDELKKRHKIRYTWVKGHNDHEENERVDKMACDIRR
jgi:ribonuclease HI